MRALLYLQFRSFINRLILRLKRLKRPKYLIGGVVGVLYFYFYFFGLLFRQGRRPSSNFPPAFDQIEMLEALAAALLLVIVILAWIIPHGRAALIFTEAEINFLFPAPISRRTLVHFKLLKAQVAILFTTLIFTLLTRRFGGGGAAWMRAIGWWLILSTLNLHFIGSSFARTMLLERGISNWKRRILVLALIAAIVALIVIWSRQTIPNFELSDLLDADSAKDYFRQVATAGPAPWLLYPFRLIVRPFFAADLTSFAIGFGAAAVILLLHYFWVIRANVAFEEASVDLSRRIAERISAARSGNIQARPTKAKRSPFELGPTGAPAVALLWKNLIAAGQLFTLRLWIILAACLLPSLMAFASSMGKLQIGPLIGIGALAVAFSSLVIGPQMLRQDFRHDLELVDVLKTYPMRGWQVVFGELLAPAVILTGFQWLLIIAGAAFFTHISATQPFLLHWRLILSFSVAIILPMFNFVSLLIPNASVLIFPGWFQTRKDGAPQGIEATGQRLILLLGQLLVFILAVLPAALAFAVVALFFRYFQLLLMGIPLASVAAAAILATEVAIAIWFLGRIFERFDLSAEA